MLAKCASGTGDVRHAGFAALLKWAAAECAFDFPDGIGLEFGRGDGSIDGDQVDVGEALECGFAFDEVEVLYVEFAIVVDGERWFFVWRRNLCRVRRGAL